LPEGHVAISLGKKPASVRPKNLFPNGTTLPPDPELVLYPAFNDTHNHAVTAATLTLIGGRPEHDPDGLLGPEQATACDT
jgi:hypothetical protein